ncbi:hypothetical protein BC628DRAFT_1391941 [Trametes gibbosa]|nr:hypothetical protein BC628DRAFT_1391941 [Trametes gibbosa]
MPIDGHSHLIKQGWSGKGTGLRNGAIAKPITVTQKKTLAGIGKDRDEAFPFWDHVFHAAAVSIQLKLHKDTDDESSGKSDDEGGQIPALELKRTTTGILSNRRPISGTPALSGATTPSDSQTSSRSSGSGIVTPQLSLMAVAKQQAARRMLYASFYRGPTLAADEDEDEDDAERPESSTSAPSLTSSVATARTGTQREGSRKRKMADDEERREKKRRRREAKERNLLKGKGKASANTDVELESEDKEGRAARKLARAERRQRKAEKRSRKEERRKKKAERKATSVSPVREDTAGRERVPVEDDAMPIPAEVLADTQVQKERREKKARKAKVKAAGSHPR